MNSETSLILGRLQADSIKRTGPVSQWLDAHKEEVLILAAEKGASMTEELLGLQRGHLYSWARRRNIILPKKPKEALMMGPGGTHIGRMGGSYDLKYVRGSHWACPLGHEWHFSNVTSRQAKAEGLDRCPQCSRRGKGKATRTPL